MKRPIPPGVEQDVFTSWRRYYCYTQRAGVTAWIKRRFRRRERHQAKHRLSVGGEE